MVAFGGVWLPQSIGHIGTQPMPLFPTIENMNKKDIDNLERICMNDGRYVANLCYLKEMDDDYGIGHPVLVWTEAMVLADAMMNSKAGRDKVFERWGVGMKERQLYAVRRMAIYILEHPVRHGAETSLDEIARMKSILWRQQGRLDGRRNKDCGYGRLDVMMSVEMAAECSVVDRVKRKAIKAIIKELVRVSASFGFTMLSALLSLVTVYNNEMDGALDDEKDEVLNLLYKKQTQERELKAKLEQGEAIFSEQQIAASGIKNNRRMWLEAMYLVLHDTDNNDTKTAEVDFCIGFLVVLRLNGEFNYKGGLDNFFTLMNGLFGVEVDKNERSGIARYVQKNGCNFENWPDTPEKRFIRKSIAKRLWIAFDNKKRKWGFF